MDIKATLEQLADKLFALYDQRSTNMTKQNIQEEIEIIRESIIKILVEISHENETETEKWFTSK